MQPGVVPQQITQTERVIVKFEDYLLNKLKANTKHS